jgi:2-dehydropantoate 2-reductase
MAPRILVFGTGSIGAVYTYLLSRAVPASNITTICRSNYEAVLNYGITINSTSWGNGLKVKPAVAKSATDAVESSPEPFDYILVCTKALSTNPSTAELISPAVSRGTSIVLIQNGIGIEEDYAKRFPENPIISTVVYLPATQVSPGVVEHKEVELLHVGTYPATADAPAKDAAKAFVDLLGAAGAHAELHDDVQEQRWSKLLVNTSWNPICALARLRDRQFLDVNEDAEAFIKDVMMEVASVAQAYGYADINEELVDFQIGRAVVRSLPGVQPSMLADTFSSKSLEVEAIVGNVVKMARDKGVKVPILRTIYLLASGLSKSFEISRT